MAPHSTLPQQISALQTQISQQLLPQLLDGLGMETCLCQYHYEVFWNDCSASWAGGGPLRIGQSETDVYLS